MQNDEDLTPQNLTPDLVEQLAKPIGFIVLQWAMIEQALVGQIEAVGHLGTAAGINVRRQGAFSDRVKVMRRLLESLPQLSPYKHHILALLDNLQNMQALRHTLVHGALQGLVPSHGKLIFNRLQPSQDQGGHDISQVSVKVEDLQKAMDAVAELRLLMTIAANELMKKFGQ